MANSNIANGGEIARNISERGTQLFNEASAWVTGNSLGILIAAAVGAGIALVLLGLRSLGCRLIEKGGGDLRWRVIFARVLAKTSFFFIVMTSAMLVAGHADTPPALYRIVSFLFVIAASFQAAIWARELILGYVQHRVGASEESGSTLGSAMGIIRLLVTVALFAIAIVLILSNLGVNVTGLVAGLGIGGIAIGLAAQGIFSDLFAALSILFDKPFRKGDGISWDTTTGTVEQIGLKTTRIRSVEGQQIIISNANLLNKEVNNLTNLDHRRITLTLSVTYQTPPDVCANIPELAANVVNAHDRATTVRCGMTRFGASSLDFELLFDVHSADLDFIFATRGAVCIALLKAFNEAGIAFAYPTQTTFTADPEGKMIMPYAPTKMVATEDGEGSEPHIVER